MPKSFPQTFLLLFGLASVLGAQSPESIAKPNDPAEQIAPSLKQFVEVLSTVQAEAPDEQPLDKLIYEGAIPSMLRELDPHTQFFDPAQFRQLQQMEESEQKGFGSVVSVLPGQVIFLQTLPGTPSNKAGIQPGDELVAINNISIASLEPQQIVELLTEARQQRVTVHIRRQGSPKLLAFTLTPELVDSPSVDRAFMLAPGTGYIRLTSWDLQTAKQLRDAIDKLGGNSLHGLVLDLRNNPGGIVKAAIEAATMFLQPGQRILSAKGRTGEGDTADVPKGAVPYKFKLAILINEKTASASEILSGALQDHDRAIIVGLPSYGKGLVQSVVPLSNGAGLAITTAFYYTPSGRSIQRPLRNSALSETFSSLSKQIREYKTDKGRVVTGGGGIQPDIQVESAIRTQLETVLDASGVMTEFATQYLSAHSPLTAGFEITPEILDELKVFLSSRRIQPSIAEWSEERSWIAARLKEEIVTQARGVDKGDEVAAQHDPQIQAALRGMADDTLLAASGSH
ncbi:MAG: S41 family peptidase [Acidobacteriaceae bacterium]|nr:S41 family peptidase [Acidobacteriaceae bacterium]MBV9779944.1 S41 family peptidase [Acidobacteriaceae bacterium]